MTLAQVLAAAAVLPLEERRRLVAALQALDGAPLPVRRGEPDELEDEDDSPPRGLDPYAGADRWRR